MADFSTFTCDKCGTHYAMRLEFVIGCEDDPADGHRSNVKGHADLCPAHMFQFAQLLAREADHDKQRSMWKTWSRK